MSRICVKFLPRHMTQERMLEVFSRVGDVTDVRLLKTQSGQKRNMGFVGFRNEEDASNAIEVLNNTFVDTSKIHVEVAKAIGAPDLERPWSKHSKGSSRYELAHPELKKKKEEENAKEKEKEREREAKDKKKVDKNDPKLLEFLGIHQKAKKWENDANMAEAEEEGDTTSKKRKNKDEAKGKKNKKSKVESKSEESNKKEEKKPKKGPTSKAIEEKPSAKVAVVTKDEIAKDKVLQEEFGDSDDEYEDLPSVDKQPLYLGNEEEMQEAELEDDLPVDDDEEDDFDYIKSKMQSSKTEESEEESGSGSDESEEEEEEKEKEKKVSEADTGRLFVRNLPFTITEDELRELFGKYGTLTDVHIPQDKGSNRSKGIALVLFMVPNDASKAMKALDKSIFQGRVLHVIPGEEQRNADAFRDTTVKKEAGLSSFKDKKLKEQKAKSTSAHNWNSLYVRSDAVVDAFCARNNVTREEIYDPSQPNLAVQLALMESQTVVETKEYFERQGVNIDVLSSSVDKAVKRSNTVILIKNIPFESTSNELTQQFEKHGPIARVVVPPSRTVAIIEFINQPDAKSAFKSLAYRQYRGVPLFLEWAPLKVFDTPTPSPSASSLPSASSSLPSTPVAPVSTPYPSKAALISTSSKVAPPAKPSQTTPSSIEPKPSQPQAAPQTNVEPAATLYVTNISFKTEDKSLISLFSKLPGYKNMTIPKKLDKKTNLPTLSAGNAFANFETPEQATAALTKLQGTSVDGFKLRLEYTTAKKKEAGIPTTIAKPKKQSEEEEAEAEEGSKTVLPGQSEDQGPTKIIVRNIPFEANQEELKSLFKSVGGYKGVRLPQKMDHKHRGFGFVEFLTHNEAKKALETMSNTHLYGRHLVLEFAKADRNLEEIREKTRRDFEKLSKAEGKPRQWFDA